MQVLEDYKKRIQQSVAGFCFKYHMSGLCENLNSVCVSSTIFILLLECRKLLHHTCLLMAVITRNSSQINNISLTPYNHVSLVFFLIENRLKITIVYKLIEFITILTTIQV